MDFGGSRVLTSGFTGVFEGATAIFPVRAMGYEDGAVGKSKGGDFACAAQNCIKAAGNCENRMLEVRPA